MNKNELFSLVQKRMAGSGLLKLDKNEVKAKSHDP